MGGSARTHGAGAGVAVAPGAVAPVGVRVGAFTIDVVAVGAVSAATFAVTQVATGTDLHALLVADAVAVAFGIGQWVAEATTGATLGSALLRIRTLSVTTGRPAGLARILLRQLVVGLGSLVCGLGAWVVAASGAWDKGVAQRGWHDKAAGTLVLRADAVGRAVPADPAGAYASAVARAVGQPTAMPGPAPEPEPLAAPREPAVPAMPAPEPEPLAAVPAMPGPAPEPPAAPRVPAVPTFALPAHPGAHASDLPSPYTGAVPAVAAVPAEPPARPRGDGSGLLPGPPGFEDLGDLEHTRLRPMPPERALAAAPARALGLRLAFDTGEVVDVSGDGVVGRNPDGAPGVAHVVAIDDPDRSVSKLHLAFGPHGPDGLWVVDRGSTNGTVLVRPDGRRVTLPAGAHATIGAGWAVRFGERTVRVETR